ncbi:hypothetical protein B2K_39285 [Paenibacillus mucilaginosus K02]|uniref:Uncharacterized protein n=1 Tax=Paenibacillus mucilaginosus K02 TaxID=997761 RepID=R9UPU5_9BACL|nr:hypothetical protein B2K_39285 [Paenibacillus mucilaginosus K02]
MVLLKKMVDLLDILSYNEAIVITYKIFQQKKSKGDFET